jgi:hypothetical protein
MSQWPLKLDTALRRLRQEPRPEAVAESRPLAATTGSLDDLVVGEYLAAEGGLLRLSHREIVGKHLHCVGATGTGKSVWIVSVIAQLLARGIAVLVVDAKGDLCSMTADMLTDRLLSSPDRETALSNIRVVDPFSSANLVAWNLCARDETVPMELQAYELGTLMMQSVQADTGIRQGRLLHNLLALIIDGHGTLIDAHRALVDPPFLAAFVSRASDERLRHYFLTEFSKEPKVTLSGVVARLDALLRLPSWRRMFDCDEGLDFQGLLAPGVTLIDIGGAPLGCRDLQSFAGRLLFLRLARAVMNRPVMSNDLLPVVIVIDEVQEFLSPEVASEMERLLTLARSRKVALYLFHQQVAQLEKISSALPKIINTNASLKLLFRSSLEDARLFGHVLPATGRVLRPDYRPDQASSSRSPYLTLAEERQLLLEKIPRLPSRSFYFWYAEGRQARLLRSADVPLAAWQQAAKNHTELRDRVLRGCLPPTRPRPKPAVAAAEPRNTVTARRAPQFSSAEGDDNAAGFLPEDLEELG